MTEGEGLAAGQEDGDVDLGAGGQGHLIGEEHLSGVLLDYRAEDGLLSAVATCWIGRHCSLAHSG